MGNNGNEGDFMRALPTCYVKENSILAEDLYNAEGRVLVKKGAKLSKKLLDKIETNKVFTVYVEDPHNDIEVVRLVEQSFRVKGMLLIKSIFEAAKKEKSIFELHDELKVYAEDMLYELRSFQNEILEHIDIKNVDNYIFSSSLNVAVLSSLIAWELGYSNEMVKEIFIGSVYHDIGISLIDDTIINKNTPLTQKEKFEILMHPKKGHAYIKSKTFLSAYVKTIVLQHHECIDGTGYPSRLTEKDIHPIAQIVGIADIYDAMTSDRPYKRAENPKDAIEYIIANTGTKFNSDIIKAFNKKIAPFPPGCIVELSDGSFATVDAINHDMPLRPKIRIIEKIDDEYKYTEVDLAVTQNLLIKDISYLDI